MNKLYKKTIKIFRLKKCVKKEILWLTESLPCVNLSVKGVVNLSFYNNSDLVVVLKINDIEQLFSFGKDFFRCTLYCLCLKNSINKY